MNSPFSPMPPIQEPHTDPVYNPPQSGLIPGARQGIDPAWQPFPSNQNLAQWMSNYMKHVGHDSVTGQPVHMDASGQHYIAGGREQGGGDNGFQEPALPQGPGEPDPFTEPTPLPVTPANNHYQYMGDWAVSSHLFPNGRPNPFLPGGGYHTSFKPDETGGPGNTRQPWEDQPPFFEGAYGSIPTDGGFAPNLGGAQNNFTGSPSLYSTSWTHDPQLGWVPKAQLPDQGGGGGAETGGGGMNFGGGGHVPSGGGQVGVGTNTTPQESVMGKIARYAPYIGPIASIFHGIKGYSDRHGPGTVGGPAHVVGGKPNTAHPVSPPTPTSGLLSPKDYGQATFGGVTPTGYRDPKGSAAWDQHANAMQLMNSTVYGGQPNRNLVSDRLNEERSLHPFAAHGNSMARYNALMKLYGATGVHTNAAMTAGG